MADKRISQLIERTDIANNDVLPIVASGATTTNKVTVSTLQEWMQDNLDVGVTSVGVTIGTSGTDVNVSGSPITTSGNITINIPTATATVRGVLSSSDWSTFNGKQNAITLTTTGSSGVATLVGSTLNIPNYTTAMQNQYVPYVGAIGSVTLGANNLSASTILVDGPAPTSGGFLGFKQATSVNTGQGGYTSIAAIGTSEMKFTFAQPSNFKEFSFSTQSITAGVSGGRIYTMPDASGTLALTSDLGGYVTLGTVQTITGQKTFNSTIVGQDATLTNSGSNPTLLVTHSSGSGIALDISKGGNGEGLRVTKTSGTGNAVTITGGALSAEAGQFSGDLQSATRVIAAASSQSIILTPNSGGTTNRVESVGTLPLALVSAAAITLASGGTTPQITLATTGAVTLTGALNGTSASFNGNVSLNLPSIGGTRELQFPQFNATNAKTIIRATGTSDFRQHLDILMNTAQSDSAPTQVVRIANSGAATFSSSVTTGGTIRMSNAVVNRAVIIGVDSASEPSIQAVVNNSDVPRQLSINPLGGNVGIGTTSPHSRLHVVNTANTLLQLNGNNTTAALDTGFTISADDSKNIYLYQRENASAIFATNNTERMRITLGGYLKASNTGSYVGATADNHELRTDREDVSVLISNSHATNPYGITVSFTAAAPFNTTNYFFRGRDSATSRFIVYSNGNVVNTNGSYGAISDVKLKENIEDATPKLDDLMKVKVRNYNLIGDDKKQIGVIAQELEEVFPAMIDESEDFEEVEVPQLDEEGNEVLNEEGEVVTEKQRVSKGTSTKSVKYSVFVPMLIKAMQEQQEQIKEQQKQIDSLKNQIK